MNYGPDVLEDFDPRRKPTFPKMEASIGMVVEDCASGFCGDVVKLSIEAVTLRSRNNTHRHFTYKEGGFRFGGKIVTLVRPTVAKSTTKTFTASGSVADPKPPAAKVARASRIWVEGKHDAELVEHVWGDDLRDLGIVVEALDGIDDLAGAVAGFCPSAQRRLGVLVDHLVPGSKESRIAATVRDRNVLVTGHPFVDVWAGIRPKVFGLTMWPEVPRGVPWKEGMCAALGTDVANFWPRLRNTVKSYADLTPELNGAVEQLIDFVTEQG